MLALLSHRVTVGHSELRHPVQRRASHQQLRGLPRETARAGPLPENHLEAENRHLGQRAPVVVILALPLRPSVPAQAYLPSISVLSSRNAPIPPRILGLFARRFHMRGNPPCGCRAPRTMSPVHGRNRPDRSSDREQGGYQRPPGHAGEPIPWISNGWPPDRTIRADSRDTKSFPEW